MSHRDPAAGSGTTGQQIALSAPAKINLGLTILGTRADGFHLLESLFVPIDLADELHVAVAATDGPSKVHLVLEVAADAAGVALGEIPTDERNLATCAASRFVAAAGLSVSVSIELVKRIPAGAGLGGGSSDAAAVLRALSALHPGAIPAHQLSELALSLGADVPFFLDPRPALVRGIGEKIEPVDALPPLTIVLVNPGEFVATAQVYKIYDALAPTLTPGEAGSTMRAISGLRAAHGRSDAALVRALHALLENDLEPAAVRLCPPVGRVKRQLIEAGALAAGLSGSGATLYGVFESEARALAGLDELSIAEPGWTRLVALASGPARDGS